MVFRCGSVKRKILVIFFVISIAKVILIIIFALAFEENDSRLKALKYLNTNSYGV